MIYVSLLIRADTGEVAGSISSTTKEQIIPQFKHPVIALRVVRNHPAIYDQTAWHAPEHIILGTTWGRQLRRKDEKQR